MNSKNVLVVPSNRAFGFFSPELSPEAARLAKIVCRELAATRLYKAGQRISASDLIADARDRITARLATVGIAAPVEREYRLSRMSSREHNGNDRADLVIDLASPHGLQIVVEFDTVRADQVAKKFVSRAALAPCASTIYIAFCYPGTASMSVSEVIKYFAFMCDLAKGLGMAGCLGFVPVFR